MKHYKINMKRKKSKFRRLMSNYNKSLKKSKFRRLMSNYKACKIILFIYI